LLGDLSAEYNLVIPKLACGELSLIFSDAKQLKGYYATYFPDLTIITA
jgi:hypothetical protein